MDKDRLKTEYFLLGGSFDPVHMGHVNLVEYVIEELRPKQLWLIPAAEQPLKKTSLLPFAMRVELIEQAFAGLIKQNKVILQTIEMQLPRPSYTSQTIRELFKQHPGHNFRWVFGDDIHTTISKWYDLEWLQKNMPILICNRTLPKESADVLKFQDRISLNNVIWPQASTKLRKELVEMSSGVEEAVEENMPPATWQLMKAYIRDGALNGRK